MKTVSLAGKIVKFGELKDGAIFADRIYPNYCCVYIKTGESVFTDEGFGVCIFSTSDICVEGVTYTIPVDYEVLELDTNLNINVEIIMKKEGLKRIIFGTKKRQKPQVKGGKIK